MLNKPCIASDGSWLLPVSVWGDGIGGGKLPESLRDVSGANLFVSTDGGQSFRRRGLAGSKRGGSSMNISSSNAATDRS